MSFPVHPPYVPTRKDPTLLYLSRSVGREYPRHHSLTLPTLTFSHSSPTLYIPRKIKPASQKPQIGMQRHAHSDYKLSACMTHSQPSARRSTSAGPTFPQTSLLTILATYSPVANELVNPGLLKPNSSINPFRLLLTSCRIMKSVNAEPGGLIFGLIPE
jgi:hypothetical protein